MKNLTRWILVLVPLVSAAGLTGGLEPQQQRPKAEKMDKLPVQRGRGEKQAALKKLVPTSKTSLAEAIGLAEKETTGKAFSAGFEIREGKPFIAINLFVADSVTIANVDPETKKVTILPKKERKPGAPADGEDAGDDEEGG